MSGVQRLVRFRGDRGRLNGICRSNHIGMVRLDVNPSPSEIHVLPVQDRISTHSGIWCVSRTLWGIPLSHLRMPFDVIWEMLGFKDEFDFVEMGED